MLQQTWFCLQRMESNRKWLNKFFVEYYYYEQWGCCQKSCTDVYLLYVCVCAYLFVRDCNRYCVSRWQKTSEFFTGSVFCTVDKANAFELSSARAADGATSDTFAYGLVRFVFHLTLFRSLQNQVSERDVCACVWVCSCTRVFVYERARQCCVCSTEQFLKFWPLTNNNKLAVSSGSRRKSMEPSSEWMLSITKLRKSIKLSNVSSAMRKLLCAWIVW